MDREVVICSAVRTPMGKFGGALARTGARALGALVIREALDRGKVPAEAVDEVLMGCVLQAGLGQNVARQCALDAGLPETVSAATVNNVCGSGLTAVNLAADRIRSGSAQVVVAGGTENMSQAPYLLPQARFGCRMNHKVMEDSMIRDALWDAFRDCHMGITAENIARRFSISREEQDEFALLSQEKCQAALAREVFRQELCPVTLSGEDRVLDRDEAPRAGVTLEKLGRLAPAFLEGGTVTAGNSSGINDGAAALVLMSADRARELGITPLAVYRGGASAGVSPAYMGLGAAEAARKLCGRMGLSPRELTLIEANEAFAAQSIACARLALWEEDKLNVNGGAIALGHPVGASGCRILVTLLHELGRRGGGMGLATLCVGGGMGVSALVEI